MAGKTKRKASASPERDLPTRDDVLLTRLETAQLMGVTERWVQRALQRGYFPFVRVGKLVRVRRSDINAYLDAQTKTGSR